MTTLPIVIRAIRPADKQALRDGTDRLSERSRYRRFLSPHGSLTPAELTYFTEVDHHDHEALVAIDPITGEGIGVARYIRSPAHPDAAELAVAVADDWQHHGVGTRLAEALAQRARQEGITRFTALLFADNTPMLRLIKSLGIVHDVSVHQGIVELTVELPPDGVGSISQLLRATAAGELHAAGHPGPGRSLRALSDARRATTSHRFPGDDQPAMDTLRSLDDLDVDGKRVLVRVDLNVPLSHDADGAACVADDTRIRAALPTIEELRGRGARLVLVSHLGRPADRDPDLSLRPVADRLAQLIGAPVTLAPAVVGAQVEELTERLTPGEILMLENVRYEPGETKNDPELASAARRARRRLRQRRVRHRPPRARQHRGRRPSPARRRRPPDAARGRACSARSCRIPERPLVAVLGGAKVSDKIGVVERFLELADVLCIGGAMAFPFLAAQGHRVGASRCAEADLEPAAAALVAAAASRCRLELPAGSRDRRAQTERERHEPERLTASTSPTAGIGLDIGPRTAARYAEPDRRGRHRLLERADGPLRARAVRRRHPRRRQRGRRAHPRPPSSAAARRSPRCARFGLQPTRSPTSPPAAAPRSSCSKAASCPASRRCCAPTRPRQWREPPAGPGSPASHARAWS